MSIIQVITEKPNKNIKEKDSKPATDQIQAAIDRGIDVSMLADNLRRSVAERIRRHQIALNMAQKLRKVKPSSREIGTDRRNMLEFQEFIS